jgi:hypothetical protein
MRVNVLAAAAILATVLGGAALAQDAPPQVASGQERPGRGAGVGGQITAIEGSTVTLETFSGGSVKVKITSATRFMKDREEAKRSDFKPGDRVFVSGEQDKDGVWSAQMVRGRSGGGGFSHGPARDGAPEKPEDNGRSYILGEVTKIDGTKLTIRKPDNTEQVIEVDDETSFRNGRESATFADVKIGDFVRGQGTLKNGVFVPRELNAGRVRGARQGIAAPDAAPQDQSPAAPVSNDQKQ